MYTKAEASLVRQKFWTNFGKYMQPVTSASCEKVNWINYKTGIKGIGFKMNADNNSAFIAIEISLNDRELQNKYYNLFLNSSKELQNKLKESWYFNENHNDEYGKNTSRISIELNEINIYRESDWPAIITFLKQHIIALDTYWAEYKVAFELIEF